VRRYDRRMDPLAGSPWSAPATVAGFTQSPPNATLVRYAEMELAQLVADRVPSRGPGIGGGYAVDIGCGAGRNSVPLARLGWRVLGTDLSWPMLAAARDRARAEHLDAHLHVALAPMEALPARSGGADLVIAHGIWNLARSSSEFRGGVREAARACRPGAARFVFTFSRNTLAADAVPIAGEPFVFTDFSGDPQCFLTESQLLTELANAGFHPDPAVPLTEHNRRPSGTLAAAVRTPVIYEAAFRYRGA
jgi:SAM-dependent methyltransferase